MILASAAGWLAQTPSNPVGPEFGKASPIGFVIIVALLVGTVLLVRSMNKQLRKLPDTFEPEHPELDQAADEGTDRGAAGEPPTDGKNAEPPTGSAS
ncbi:hypothetical protein [Rhodococcus maanshanensis]|uniref:Uncharacterized protein n=1 Tax=Rhodococcus maanshanensis TaxID=183556 RepID=A0A1H7MS26_9NOCA|nr:hypothetical protein [Rhodococcus maanshanensis]SEL14062.1 hypothetical protein SAMN05444583_106126 [Rhodococcus maanshanensis]